MSNTIKGDTVCIHCEDCGGLNTLHNSIQRETLLDNFIHGQITVLFVLILYVTFGLLKIGKTYQPKP